MLYDGRGRMKGARGKDNSGEGRREVVGMKGRVGMEEESGMEGRVGRRKWIRMEGGLGREERGKGEKWGEGKG